MICVDEDGRMKIWSYCVRMNMQSFGLFLEDAYDWSEIENQEETDTHDMN